MFEAHADIESLSPYSQSKVITTRKKDKETHEDHEKRVWRERLHTNEKGEVFIPPTAFKNNLSEAAKYLSIQIPGKGKATYTKHFEAGILVVDSLILPIPRDDVQGEWVYVPSDGRRGGTTRVWKCFPLIPEWAGTVRYLIFDETITYDVFRYHLEQAGQFIGLGRFRPRNNGYYGRFKVNGVEWSER